MSENIYFGRISFLIPKGFFKTKYSSSILDGPFEYYGEISNIGGKSINEAYKCIFERNISSNLLIQRYSKDQLYIGDLYWPHKDSASVANFDCIFFIENTSIYKWSVLIGEEMFDQLDDIVMTISNNITRKLHIKETITKSFVLEGGCLQVPHNYFSELSNIVYGNKSGIEIDIIYKTGYIDASSAISLEELEEDDAYVFRYGKRQVGNFDGFEMCFISNDSETLGNVNAFFMFESKEVESAIFMPFISVCLTASSLVPNHDFIVRTTKLWDFVINSVKINE